MNTAILNTSYGYITSASNRTAKELHFLFLQYSVFRAPYLTANHFQANT